MNTWMCKIRFLTEMSREVKPVKLAGRTNVSAVVELTLYCAVDKIMRQNEMADCNMSCTAAEHFNKLSLKCVRSQTDNDHKHMPVMARKILLRFMMGVGGHLHTGDEDASPSSAYARFAGRHPDGGQNKVQLHTGDIVVPTDTSENPFKHREIQAGNDRMNVV